MFLWSLVLGIWSFKEVAGGKLTMTGKLRGRNYSFFSSFSAAEFMQ